MYLPGLPRSKCLVLLTFYPGMFQCPSRLVQCPSTVHPVLSTVHPGLPVVHPIQACAIPIQACPSVHSILSIVDYVLRHSKKINMGVKFSPTQTNNYCWKSNHSEIICSNIIIHVNCQPTEAHPELMPRMYIFIFLCK